MLSHLLERGLGQVVAPDPKHTTIKTEPADGSQGFRNSLWNIVAPDPNFVAADQQQGGTTNSCQHNQNPMTPQSAAPTIQSAHCHNLV
mmetsp:Transcript_5867/g.6826  ORF Transcript_5867/g.6826 Transcript_5867/m.6826 type:complete len:88 (+) Transcript_5867:63-326(+)